MTPEASVVILNWNGKEFLRDCLSSILKQSYNNFKVILVDNNSTDGSVDFVKDNFPEVEVIALNMNYGFVAGNNIGIKYALEKYNPDYILLLNNDTKIVRQDTLKRLIGIAENDKKTGILGCKLIYPDGRIQDVYAKTTRLSLTGFISIHPKEKNYAGNLYKVDIVNGAAFLIKRSVIDKIGLLDEGFSPMYGEEIDFCIRARRCGYLIKVVPSLEVIHYVGQSIKKQPFNYMFLATKKNNIRFMLLNFPLDLLIIRMLCEFYFVLGNIFASIWERKDKKIELMPYNLKVREGWKDNLVALFDSYLLNIKNLREIIWKRTHRTEKLWF